MQTIYYTTAACIPGRDNIVDLEAYRRRLSRAAAPQEPEEPQPPVLTLLPPAPHPRRSALRRRRGLLLDACASMGVLVMTLTFTLRILAM